MYDADRVLQVVGPIGPGEFEAGDFPVLSAYELRKRVQPVVDALQSVTEQPEDHDRWAYHLNPLR